MSLSLPTRHEMMANALMSLAEVQLRAAIHERRRQRENPSWAMLTGRKRA